MLIRPLVFIIDSKDETEFNDKQSSESDLPSGISNCVL